MVKENAVYPYNGLLVSNKKEQIIDMCYIEGSQILNKADWERQIPYGLSYMWNLKIKTIIMFLLSFLKADHKTVTNATFLEYSLHMLCILQNTLSVFLLIFSQIHKRTKLSPISRWKNGGKELSCPEYSFKNLQIL